MRLGFVGYGEAAYEMSKGLSEEGVCNMVAYDHLWDDFSIGQTIKERSIEASVELKYSLASVVENVDILIVAVPADKAYAVCESILPYLRGNELYVDVSASSPDIKRAMDTVLKNKKVPFVDIAMMGPLSVYKHKVPILASGEGADRFYDAMSSYGMVIEKVSDNAGDASATKLIRSIFMKGISTLLMEMLVAATHFEVEDKVVDSIAETMDKSNFMTTMNRLITGTAIHSGRRSAELDGTLKMLKDTKLDYTMTIATKSTLDAITKLELRNEFNGIKPETWKEVITAVNNNK